MKAYYAIYNRQGYLLRTGYSKNIEDVKLGDNEVLEYSENVKDMVDSLSFYREMIND